MSEDKHYGKTTTYGDIAQRLAQERGLPRLSARAVGSAVGRNPISLIIPCHRVIGRNGRLTGYAGGEDFTEKPISSRWREDMEIGRH